MRAQAIPGTGAALTQASEAGPFDGTAPRLRLPAAILRLFSALPQASLDAAREALPRRSGVHWLRDDLCAVLPVASDPGAGDVAVQVGRELIRALGTHSGLGLLVTPGRVDLDGDRLALAPDPLLDDLDRLAPSLGPGVHLTSRKARRLEFPRQFAPAGSYRGPSGLTVPLFRAGPVAAPEKPWRSAEMLRISAPYVPRPAVDGTLATLHEVPVAVIRGGLGVGKTRSVHQALAGRRVLWTTLRPARHQGPSLGAQLAWSLAVHGAESALWAQELGYDGSGRWLEPEGAPPQLQDVELVAHLLPGWLRRAPGGPPVVVCDGLESITEADARLLAPLAKAAEAGWVNLVLVGRGEIPPTVAPRRWPVVEIPPLEGDESEAHARAVSAGLGLPPRLFERLLTYSAGCPFAFEEALASLAELDRLVERGGALRYHGPEDGEFVPSDRWIRHVEAEVARLPSHWPLRLLALNEGAIPDDRLSAAVTAGVPGTKPVDWVAGALAGGLVSAAESPWGAAVDVPWPAVREALRRTLDVESMRPTLIELGRHLTERGSPTGAWRTFPMLRGSEEGSAAAIEAAPGGAAPTAELVPALAAELRASRARGIDAPSELQRLWTLLPMARRLGVLGQYRDELARALELAVADPAKGFALAGLKAELEEESGDLEAAAETLRGALLSPGATEQGRAVLVLRLGRAFIGLGQFDEAQALLAKVVPVLDASGGSSLAASGRFHLAEIARHHHQFERARELHLEALAVRRKLANAKPLGQSLSALGWVELRAGRTTEALERFREAEEIYLRVGDEAEAASALLGIGQAFGRLGNFVGASAPLKRALKLQQEREDDAGVALAQLSLSENLLDLGRPKEALTEARQARFLLELHSKTGALAHAEQLLGRIALSQRKPTDARVHFQTAHAAHSAQEHREQAAVDVSWLLVLAVEWGRDDEVAALVRELKAALVAGDSFDRQELLEFRLYLGLERLWRVSEARVHLERAYRSLLAKTEYLPAELRNGFLSQIPEHEQLVAAATKAGL